MELKKKSHIEDFAMVPRRNFWVPTLVNERLTCRRGQRAIAYFYFFTFNMMTWHCLIGPPHQKRLTGYR